MDKYFSLDDSFPSFGIEAKGPYAVYRYLRTKEHLEQMLEGNVYISTLQECRTYENKERGDEFEGRLLYSSGIISGGSNNPDFRLVASRMGMDIVTESDNSLIAWGSSNTGIHDAYTLCTSYTHSSALYKDFGTYCVEIKNIPSFYQTMNELLREQLNITHGIAGKTLYEDRWYQGIEPPPETPIQLLKPSRYSYQREYRFVWNPSNVTNYLSPEVVSSSKLKQFFRRITF